MNLKKNKISIHEQIQIVGADSISAQHVCNRKGQGGYGIRPYESSHSSTVEKN